MTKRFKASNSTVALALVVAVFVGIVIQTIISLNGLLFSAFFLVTTNHFVLMPYWIWQYLWYHDLWSLWTVPELLFLFFPVVWGLIINQLFRLKNILIPFYVQLGSIAIDILMVVDLVFLENAGSISLIPSQLFWNLVSGAITSLLMYGLGLGLLFALLLKLVIWLRNRVSLRHLSLQRTYAPLTESLQAIRNLRKMAILIVKAVSYSMILILILIAIAFLTGWKLLDWTLIFSLAVAEVPIGVFLSLLLGERRGEPYKTIQQLNAMTQYSHLQIIQCDDWLISDYPDLRYYVVNTRTKHAFWVQRAIYELVIGGIIRSTRFAKSEELASFCAKNQIILDAKYGSLEDLGLSISTPLV